MDVHCLAIAGCACVVFVLYLHQIFLIAVLKRLLAEERAHNAEATTQALRMLEASFAERIRRLETRTEQTEYGIDAIRRHCADAAERSVPHKTTRCRSGAADGWITASRRDMRDLYAGAPRDDMAAPTPCEGARATSMPRSPGLSHHYKRGSKLHQTSTSSTSPIDDADVAAFEPRVSTRHAETAGMTLRKKRSS